MHRRLILEGAIRLGDLLLDNVDRGQALPVLPLLLEREGQIHLLPAADFLLVAGDHLLLAGPHGVRRSFELTLQNSNAMEYVLSGRDSSGGWLWQWMFRSRG